MSPTESTSRATPEQLAQLLAAIASADPPPWRPAEPSGRLDQALDSLRAAGFVRLAPVEPDRPQGYFATPEGRMVLRNTLRRTSIAPPVAMRDATLVSWLVIAAQAGVFALGLLQVWQLGKPLGGYLGNGDSPILRRFFSSLFAVQAGQWWRLFTYALVHGGILHLGMNLYGHYLDAPVGEKMWGRARFAVIYLASVLGGGVGAVLATPDGWTVGSSGGWCGIIACQAAWFFTRRHQLSPGERVFWFRHFTRVVILTAVISAIPGVSWGGHLGGAVGGGLCAGFMALTLTKRKLAVALGWLLAAVVPVASVLAVMRRH